MTSVNEGVTVSPPDTALSRVTVNASESPSAAVASSTVNAGTVPSRPSSSVIVTVAPLVLSPDALPDIESVSSPSMAVSSVGVSVKVACALVEPPGIVTVKSFTVV